MQSLDNILSVCYLFKKGKFDVEEFQSRLLTAAIPDNISKQFANELADFDNRIEEILICISPSLGMEYAYKVADDIIQATLMEQKRLIEVESYKK